MSRWREDGNLTGTALRSNGSSISWNSPVVACRDEARTKWTKKNADTTGAAAAHIAITVGPQVTMPKYNADPQA
ncbi:hypothetical protein ADCFC_20630 [Adlercreutzia hattorii]|uniref:Uncharacterized protein n=1 Tax=Adlercreutzia hattorii TaxID=2707299 RepID=A0A6F8SPR4_9ACTN|nr:hypothetical protein ADCFC_21850 [Adlercreutzia hattorii]